MGTKTRTADVDVAENENSTSICVPVPLGFESRSLLKLLDGRKLVDNHCNDMT